MNPRESAMFGESWFFWAVIAELGFALVTALVLLFISAPYGRHARGGWGPVIPARVAWVVMESPASLWFLAVYFMGANRFELVPLVLLGCWQAHYGYRTFIFPFLIRVKGRKTPLLIVLMAIAFNLLNGTVNAMWISHLGSYEMTWLVDPRFWIGLGVFGAGMTLNHRADATLRALRKPGETGYKIPRGGMYRWVSCPNYLGEIIEWTGWAILTWSTAGLAFAVYTAANLVPRALTHHQWYRDTFEDYPEERRAIFPGLL